MTEAVVLRGNFATIPIPVPV